MEIDVDAAASLDPDATSTERGKSWPSAVVDAAGETYGELPGRVARVVQPPKEFVMDETTLELVDLGEAKEVTKGAIVPPLPEDHPTRKYQSMG